MFTGIIEGLGTIKTIKKSGNSMRIAIISDFKLINSKIGDSIAVNGACLTVVQIIDNCFEVDVAPETFSKTTLKKMQTGEKVNLERALRISDRLDGHIVSGHIDGIGIINEYKKLENAIILKISVSKELCRYMITKGSVAVDGISLTINMLGNDYFELSIIPHTAKLTTLSFKKNGDFVNIETDMLGKYVYKFLSATKNDYQSKTIDMSFLAKTGFLITTF